VVPAARAQRTSEAVSSRESRSRRTLQFADENGAPWNGVLEQPEKLFERVERAKPFGSRGVFPHGIRQRGVAAIMLAARSPMTRVGASVWPVVMEGMTELSAMRRFAIPWTRSVGSTTVSLP
jgi:hypothetical protein